MSKLIISFAWILGLYQVSMNLADSYFQGLTRILSQGLLFYLFFFFATETILRD